MNKKERKEIRHDASLPVFGGSTFTAIGSPLAAMSTFGTFAENGSKTAQKTRFKSEKTRR